jgi:hypothetical protein
MEDENSYLSKLLNFLVLFSLNVYHMHTILNNLLNYTYEYYYSKIYDVKLTEI